MKQQCNSLAERLLLSAYRTGPLMIDASAGLAA
jgi:hypothetical protein